MRGEVRACEAEQADAVERSLQPVAARRSVLFVRRDAVAAEHRAAAIGGAPVVGVGVARPS